MMVPVARLELARLFNEADLIKSNPLCFTATQISDVKKPALWQA
ncbi:hypothetical protein [Shewanella fidelis]|uniref:Uncharacterized protein n=1 Tax=Shewanella fidelis TaxID=173509 RepID=A0AAW8NLS0_9GAMM|nr:hypothetical protein [Shewanella fidelis]MDR8523690.1 hypothetical protein [Shewanella fidelis]MDW4810237.1 hypothetical protein [Shewanella fidelis]MDW4814382.1 hypothetical protein [Shewanella fidelis]MDW4818473.1 hypothetical protein [Shewanella fidelis]MDW4823875.1 hypothetical protein [Shewanella fidelis]